MAKSPFVVFAEKVPAPLRSKYVLVLLLFLVWMIFFDKYDVATQIHLSRTNMKLKNEKENYYEKKIVELRKDLQYIDQNIEKFAREKYFMKRSNEEIFIIVKE